MDVPAQVELRLIGPTGYSIISDIDDTIRWSGVLDYMTLFRSTFVNDFIPVSGMPETYQRLNAELSLLATTDHNDTTTTSPSTSQANNVAFHYLSASPTGFLNPIMDFFVRNAFPPGMLHLSEAMVNTITGIKEATQLVEYKLTTAHKILTDFPKRNWIFIGDSGQSDPNIYGVLYHDYVSRHPEHLPPCIFIRAVSGVNAQLERIRNDPARFLWDLRGVPANRWVVFTNPSDISNGDFANGECYPKGEVNPFVATGKKRTPTEPAIDMYGNPIIYGNVADVSRDTNSGSWWKSVGGWFKYLLPGSSGKSASDADMMTLSAHLLQTA